MIKSINRPDLAKRFAKDLGLTYKQTEDIMQEAENVLRRMLNEREQVRIHGFGTFYVTTIKSHVIKQIRTKTPRIILEQRSVKFRPSPLLKDEIYGRTKKPKEPKKVDAQELADIKKEISVAPSREVEPKKIAVPEPPKPAITFKPASYHPLVEKAKIKKKIFDRWLSIARSNQEEKKTETEIAREALIVGNLLSQIKKAGYDSVSFSFSSDKYINIYAGRPRRQLSHLAREIIEGFLDYVDIKEFHIPQERRVVLTLNKARSERLHLEIHSFPIENGSSIRITVSGNA